MRKMIFLAVISFLWRKLGSRIVRHTFWRW